MGERNEEFPLPEGDKVQPASGISETILSATKRWISFICANVGSAIAEALDIPDLPQHSTAEDAYKFIKSGHADFVIANFDAFEGLVGDSSLALLLIHEKKEKLFLKNIDLFGPLNAQVADALIFLGFSLFVCDNLHKFPDLVIDYAFVDKIIRAKGGHGFLENLDKFSNIKLDEALFFNILNEGTSIPLLAKVLDRFEMDLTANLAWKIIDHRSRLGGIVVGANLEKFSGLVFNDELAKALNKAGGAYEVARNLDKFNRPLTEGYPTTSDIHEARKCY